MACVGTPIPCESFSTPGTCPNIVCNWYQDPPCPLDPFDVAITPFTVERDCCCPDNPECATDFCDKTRPSADGSVFYKSTFNWCDNARLDEMFVDGRQCESVKLCDGGVILAFKCADALVKSSVANDDRCPPGTRVVGRNCNDEVLCEAVGGGAPMPPTSPTLSPTGTGETPVSTTSPTTASPTGTDGTSTIRPTTISPTMYVCMYVYQWLT